MIDRDIGGTGAPTRVLIIRMEDVQVFGINMGDAGGEDRPTESISFNFGKVEMRVRGEGER